MNEPRKVVLIGVNSLAEALARVAAADVVYAPAEVKAGDMPAPRAPMPEPEDISPYETKSRSARNARRLARKAAKRK